MDLKKLFDSNVSLGEKRNQKAIFIPQNNGSRKLILQQGNKMKDGKFENQAEIYQALLDGKKLCHTIWLKHTYAHLLGNNVVDNCGDKCDFNFNSPSEWSIYKEPKEREVIELYETWDITGDRGLCSIHGEYPNFELKRMSPVCEISERHIFNKEKPTLKIYVDTFEIVRD